MPNPTLTPERINQVGEELQPGWALPGTAAAGAGTGTAAPPAGGTRTFSAERAFGTAFFLWLLVVAGAAVGWSQVTVTNEPFTNGFQTGIQTTVEPPGWMLFALLGALGLAFLTIFRPKSAPISAPLYAIAEGLFVGVISRMYDVQWNGIVLQAVLATAATFLVCLALYVTGVVKVTRKFVFVVIAATAGIFVMYMATWLLSIFGVDMAFWNDPTPLGIAVSVGICIVAALNLFIDFEMIRQLNLAGAPKQMEWYAGFSLTVTMVWLYLEILRLLSLLRR
jgi:uncharacterized YccA/Bax inhibitor family protein